MSSLELAYKAHREYLDSDSATSGLIEDYIAAVIDEAVAAEREHCAKVADSIHASLVADAPGTEAAQFDDGWTQAAESIAAKIRSGK